MPSWMIKAAVQRAVSLLPSPHFWNGIIQKCVTRSVGLDDRLFLDKLGRARGHLANYQAGSSGPAMPARVVEIGTGWFPVVPIAIWLCGAEEVETYDLVRHATEARIAATVGHFLAAWDDGRLVQALPHADRDRVARLERMVRGAAPGGFAEGLTNLGIRYTVAPLQADASARRADLVFSTAVLEYLPYSALVALLQASRARLSPGGVASHWIDLSDEYAYFDKSITPFNFLRFSDRAWRLINNPIIPLSRLRLGDYRHAFAQAGFAKCAFEPALGSAEDLACVPIAPAFRGRPDEDLLALSVWVRAWAAPAPLNHAG
ncbi:MULTISPECIES: class I SAM-dependent methyltransferase [unclassified Methylobacterium]|uniref:class I SAM-dependent methyltransferase n=1 Tax=unclassified Methylobacterium TaxID=2615210 RepID=UPI002269CA16|nr:MULTISPECIES: class I SAM-dependent methyltransferase [unclassified Methylobacterium]